MLIKRSEQATALAEQKAMNQARLKARRIRCVQLEALGMSHEHIAQRLGINSGTVKAWIQREKGASMKIGDAVEVNTTEDVWIPGKVKKVQKDGTFVVSLDDNARPERFRELELCEVIVDEEHLREKPLDKKSPAVLNDAPNGHAFHS